MASFVNNIDKDLKNRVFEYLTYFFVIAFLWGLLFSESILSISSGVLSLLAIISGNLKEKGRFIAKEKSLWMLAGVYLIYLIGMLFCKNPTTGLWELSRYLFWMTLPVSIALIPNVTEKKIWILLLIYIFFVLGATISTTIRIVFADHFQIANIRYAAHISHVSLSIQVVYAIFILLVSRELKLPIFEKLNKWIIYALCAWFFVFLGFQKSLNAWLALYGAGIVFFLWLTNRMKHKTLARSLFAVFIIIPFIYVGTIAYSYFKIKDERPNVEVKTELGNPYSFKFDDFQKENGHYVYWYINNDELKTAWNSVSDIKIDEKDNAGYHIYYTLLRYMTSKGLKKDAQGVASLSEQDIQNIQQGTSNYIFAEKKYSLQPRIYQTIWEIDYYYHTGDPNDQSLSQRIEFLKAACYIIKHNIWGVGTGNYLVAFKDAFVQIDSQLKPELQNNVHNQYINYIVKFGLLGFLIIMIFIITPIIQKRQFSNILSLIMIVIVAITCMGETTLETHHGLHFFLFFISLYIWHSPKLLSESNVHSKSIDILQV